jgi:DNA polymerase-3 subunit epsilon
MRQIVLDTETTGLSAEAGDRMIEIGCVELVNRKLTGRTFHYYLNPERESHEDALKVHGISNEFLSDKPKFFEIFEEFLEFIRDAELIIHNASFDVGFIDKELSSCGALPLQKHVVKILDTLESLRIKLQLKKKDLHPISSSQYSQNARRPKNSRMNTTKFRNTFMVEFPRWENEVKDTIFQLIKGLNK